MSQQMLSAERRGCLSLGLLDLRMLVALVLIRHMKKEIDYALEQLAWEKLKALREGADLASRYLWK